eukprot:SAG22_NODE_3736_length_1552_cov_1.273228_2_plen_111_part_00
MQDGSHDEHNEATGDNAGPVVITKGMAPEAKGLDKVKVLPEGSEPAFDGSNPGRANHYAVPSTMPPGEPTKRVEILDIEDVKAAVQETGELKFCRCWKVILGPIVDLHCS